MVKVELKFTEDEWKEISRYIKDEIGVKTNEDVLETLKENLYNVIAEWYGVEHR